VIDRDPPLAAENRRVHLARPRLAANGISHRLGACAAGGQTRAPGSLADQLPATGRDLSENDVPWLAGV
jgi:hypothetical protein